MSRLADEREAGAGREVEGDAVQDRILPVCEDHLVDDEVAFEARQARRAGPVADVRLLVEDASDLHHRRAGRLQLAVHVGELLQRLEDELQEVHRRDQRPDRERLVLVQVRAEVENRAHREHAEELDRREEDGEDPLHVRRLFLFASLSASNSAWKRRSRLNACTTAIPATDSAICAVTAAIRFRCLDVRRMRDPLEPAREDESRRQNRRTR